MTSVEVMKTKAIDTSNLPTRPVLYDDPDVKAANPFFGMLFDTFIMLLRDHQLYLTSIMDKLVTCSSMRYTLY